MLGCRHAVFHIRCLLCETLFSHLPPEAHHNQKRQPVLLRNASCEVLQAVLHTDLRVQAHLGDMESAHLGILSLFSNLAILKPGFFAR